MSKISSATNRSPVQEMPSMSQLVSDMMIKVQNGKLDDFVAFLDTDDTKPKLDKETIQEMLSSRDEEDKSALDYSSLLQRIEIVGELINRGVNINDVSNSGYSALHQAAAWGKKLSVALLVDNGAQVFTETKQNSQTAREIALRYNQVDVVEYLEWAEAKHMLINEVFNMRDIMADGEKNMGRLNREDKALINSVCTETETWITNTTEASLQDFIDKKQHVVDTFAQLNAKLAEPPLEKPDKK